VRKRVEGGGMTRDINLADLLADDTGNIRPEVAGLLMEERPLRRVVPWRQIRIPAWFILGLVTLIILKAIFSGSDKLRDGIQIARPVIPSSEAAASESSASAATEPKLTQGNLVREQYYLGKGRVFGFRVNIREQPSLDGLIMGQTNQNEVFQIISFEDGWYQVLLGGRRIGYIFGAYLLPMDFSVAPYRVGVARDKTKLLLSESRHQDWYKVIFPNGEERYIRRRHVRIVR